MAPSEGAGPGSTPGRGAEESDERGAMNDEREIGIQLIVHRSSIIVCISGV
jgi:hypothetical protein